MGRSDRSMSNKSQESEGPEQGPTEEEIQNNDLQELSQEAQGQNQESQGQDTTPGSIDLTQASELINLYNSLSEAQSAIESLSVSVQNAAPILDASEEAEEEDQFITEGLSEGNLSLCHLYSRQSANLYL